MIQAELPYFLVLASILLTAPFLPSAPLLYLDHLVVRVAILFVLLYLVSIGHLVGVFGLVAFGVLFMERNRRKIQHALKKWDALDVHQPPQATVEEASTPQKTVPVAPFRRPDEEESEFMPHDDPSDINAFEPVAPSMNEKVVLSSAYPLSGQASSSTASMESIYEQLGVGHVRGVETVGQ